MTTRIALMRHGKTAWNRAHRLQGRSDVPLDDAARNELSGLVLPMAWRSAALWSSPLSRASETARIVADREPQIAQALIEKDFGQWEGQQGAELRADPASGFRDIEDWGWDYRPPGGESPREVRSRLLPWMDSLQGDTLAICHMGVMRVALAIAHGWEFRGPCPFAIKRNRLYVIERDGDTWRALAEPIRLEEAQT